MAREEEDFEENRGSDALHTEDNLFQTLQDGLDDHDDDEDELLNIDKPFQSFEEEFEEEEYEEEEEEDKMFPDEEDDDENEEEDDAEFKEEELTVLNKKLGTNFKTVDDLKNSLKSQEEESDLQKEENEYKALTNKVGLYDRYIQLSNEELIREQLISEAKGEKRDITDTDVLDEIEEKLQGMIDLNQLDGYANTLRANLNSNKEKAQSSIDKIDNKRIETQNAISKKNTSDLQDAFAEIFTQQEFMGVTVTKEIIQKAYQSVRTNKFFESVNNSQEMIAKLALFAELEKEISKTANRPTHSDNTKSAFQTLAGNGEKRRRSVTQANGSASSGSADDNLNNFLR
jgi:type I site-specific restriction-modification system R (restriction) subunit